MEDDVRSGAVWCKGKRVGRGIERSTESESLVLEASAETRSMVFLQTDPYNTSKRLAHWGNDMPSPLH